MIRDARRRAAVFDASVFGHRDNPGRTSVASKTPSARFSGILATGLAVLLFAASPALAQHAAAKQDEMSKAQERHQSVPDLAGSQTVAADPATGKLRPITPQEARELIAAMAKMVDQSSQGLTAVYHLDGMVSVDLEDRFQSVSMARVGSGGSVATRCVTSVQEAGEFLGVAAPTPDSAPVVSLEEK